MLSLETRVRELVAKLLGHKAVNNPRFDTDRLDYAKEVAHHDIKTVTSHWIVKHFKGSGGEFVQVQSPQGKLFYYEPAVTEAVTFKRFLALDEVTKDDYVVSMKPVMLGDGYYMEPSPSNTWHTEIYQIFKLLDEKPLAKARITRMNASLRGEEVQLHTSSWNFWVTDSIRKDKKSPLVHGGNNLTNSFGDFKKWVKSMIDTYVVEK